MTTNWPTGIGLTIDDADSEPLVTLEELGRELRQSAEFTREPNPSKDTDAANSARLQAHVIAADKFKGRTVPQRVQWLAELRLAVYLYRAMNSYQSVGGDIPRAIPYLPNAATLWLYSGAAAVGKPYQPKRVRA